MCSPDRKLRSRCVACTLTIEQIGAGTLRALAVTSRERLAALKDVPTIEEAGLPGFELEVFFGLVARRATAPSQLTGDGHSSDTGDQRLTSPAQA